MLDVKCPEHLEKVREFADGLGKEARDELEKTLAYLEHYRNDTCVCELYTDFAPNSFAFTLFHKEGEKLERWFNGGVIYYGPRETGVGAPQLSVSITGVFGGPAADKPRWEVHT